MYYQDRSDTISPYMSLFPDRNPDQAKEELLKKAPFVRTFLDINEQILSSIDWSENFKKARDRVQESMDSRVGKDWYKLTAFPFYIHAEQSNILNPEISTKVKLMMIINIIVMGFEIGDPKDVDLLFRDLVRGISKHNILNPKCRHESALWLNTTTFISTLLKTGAFLNQTANPNFSGPQKDQPTNHFTDFINKLNFDGI